MKVNKTICIDLEVAQWMEKKGINASELINELLLKKMQNEG